MRFSDEPFGRHSVQGRQIAIEKNIPIIEVAFCDLKKSSGKSRRAALSALRVHRTGRGDAIFSVVN
jgi:hypothetical protein